MRVLIVEDTDSVCCALKMALEYLGHEIVETAGDGEEAVQKYLATRPDVVVMDVRMPRMDGLTCTALISRQDPNARVIVVTAGRTTAQEAREAGARAFVEKPFELSQLQQAFADATVGTQA